MSFTNTISGTSTSFKISGLADPVSAQDAVTKNYLDTKMNNITFDLLKPTSLTSATTSFTMGNASSPFRASVGSPSRTGSNNPQNIPQGDAQLAIYGYVTNISDPQDTHYAANKNYVDNSIVSKTFNTIVPITPSGGSYNMSIDGNCAGWNNGYVNSGFKWINNSNATQVSSLMIDNLGRFKIFETGGLIMAFINGNNIVTTLGTAGYNAASTIKAKENIRDKVDLYIKTNQKDYLQRILDCHPISYNYKQDKKKHIYVSLDACQYFESSNHNSCGYKKCIGEDEEEFISKFDDPNCPQCALLTKSASTKPFVPCSNCALLPEPLDGCEECNKLNKIKIYCDTCETKEHKIDLNHFGRREH